MLRLGWESDRRCNGCFRKWWYPLNTPKWSFLVGKPLVVGYQPFRNPSYKYPYFKKKRLLSFNPDKKKLGPTRAILNSNPFASGCPPGRRVIGRCRQHKNGAEPCLLRESFSRTCRLDWYDCTNKMCKIYRSWPVNRGPHGAGTPMTSLKPKNRGVMNHSCSLNKAEN